MVAMPKPSKFLLSSDSASSFPDHHHGCFRHRLGLPILLRSSIRPLVCKGASLTYQCKGVMSSFHLCQETSIHSQTVRIMSDNMMVVHCINRQGTSRSSALLKVSEKILFLAHRRSIYLSAPRTSGQTPLPTKRPHQWWHLKPSVFAHLIHHFGIPPNRSIRDERECSGPPLPLALLSDSCKRPRRICRKLEPMASHIPLPSSTNSDHAGGSAATKE